MRDKTFISFDWALKRLLRDKANFGVLEGLSLTDDEAAQLYDIAVE